LKIAKLSRFISHKMEEENVPELVDALEVSSPGVDYPLKFKRQYPQHLGRTMSIKLADGKLVEGKLKLVDEAEIVLDAVVKLKGKKPSYEEQRIAFSNILESKIKIVF